MQARYYDPVIGRFYSNDPVGFRDIHSFNRYAYANNNPYKYTDPDGRLPILVPLVIFAAKELASEAVESATGIPMPTVKNAGKFAIKQVTKSVRQGIKDQGVEAAKNSANIKKQATALVKENGNKNRVTMRSPSQKVEIDLDGKAHNGVPTPHTKTSTRNLQAPNQPAYNTKGADTTRTTQKEIRAARKFLEKENKS
ncbi:RHS repeat-associated core domain-containing protein [Pseudoalteromonas sp. Of11M-6]|uniref:RHS repeat-associated core domain-containing protein n=1 Tax=Pseudoalteromonas sp. Of11M-6 TaxID=2917754 RepID=UPI001EF730C9|nr:RHS repeat-associated core domain-containing protein [Pseudoalteromonas sp. Of11M-6]MCG7556405.1 polymorphic toxin type 24 domain-containing protein [Pseudoalteromonas sp. Of11M-6]